MQAQLLSVWSFPLRESPTLCWTLIHAYLANLGSLCKIPPKIPLGFWMGLCGFNGLSGGRTEENRTCLHVVREHRTGWIFWSCPRHWARPDRPAFPGAVGANLGTEACSPMARASSLPLPFHEASLPAADTRPGAFIWVCAHKQRPWPIFEEKKTNWKVSFWKFQV